MSMNENNPEMRDQSAGGSRGAEANLSEEFREFGRQLTLLLKTVRESPRAKEAETQVTQALNEMERQVNQAMSKARERMQAQDLQGTIKGAAATAADETQRGLARGLHALNERMAKANQDMEKNRPPSSGPAGGEAA